MERLCCPASKATMTTTTFANPFLPSFSRAPEASAFDSETTLVDADVADAREVSYALVQSGPAVSADEVESHVDAVEVKVRWESQVLSLSHLESGKGFAIGEGGDFEVPGFEGLRMSVVESRMGSAYAVVPPNATATVSARGEVSRSLASGEEIALAEGMTVTIHLDPVTIEISQVRAGKKFEVGFLAALASGAAACIGLSFVGHAAIVASLAMFMPKMNADDAEAISRDQILMMQTMLNASAEREDEPKQDEQSASADVSGGGSKGGEPHQGETGAAGTTKPVTTKGHMAFQGSDDQVRLSRKEELALAANFGVIGILGSNAPLTGMSSPWAKDTQLGQDAENRMGSMFGEKADDMMGYGLGLWGTGQGGGGKGEGIGIDGVGNTVGGGGGGPGKWGYGKGDKNGWGNGHAPTGGGHLAKAPIMRPPPTIETNGRLPAEVIQRIVRQNFGRFRLCYEAGLRNNPALTGRVVTKFVIGRDGSVMQASDAGSDLASQEVVSCVVRSFGNLSFPQPDNGVATVVYPIALSPGE
jgi:hypothetical protein